MEENLVDLMIGLIKFLIKKRNNLRFIDENWMVSTCDADDM